MALGALALAAALAGCAPTVLKHGHQFQENDIQKVQQGMSPQQVSGTLGSPTTKANVSGNDVFYYISSTEKQTAFLTPEETERTVLAVYFSKMGSVERVAQYGLKDGKVINFSTNQTADPSKDESVLKGLFRNLGSKPLFGE